MVVIYTVVKQIHKQEGFIPRHLHEETITNNDGPRPTFPPTPTRTNQTLRTTDLQQPYQQDADTTRFYIC